MFANLYNEKVGGDKMSENKINLKIASSPHHALSLFQTQRTMFSMTMAFAGGLAAQPRSNLEM